MGLSLFWRLSLGYATVLVLSLATSIYAIVQLGVLSQTARGALDGDYRTLAQQEALTDAFLSEVRYGGKYLLTQSPASFEQFRQFKADSLRQLQALKTSGHSSEIATKLARLEQLHQSYHTLFDQEAGYLKAGQPHAQSRYQKERDKLVDIILRELAQLKDQMESMLHNKLTRLSSTADKARIIAITSTLLLLMIGAVWSLKLSRNVTKPLAILTERFRSNEPLETGTLVLSSIPEIQELAVVLADRKRQLLLATEDNAEKVGKITEDLGAKIGALKRQLGEIKDGSESMTAEQGRVLIDRMSSEIDNLLRHYARLNAAAVAHAEVVKLTGSTPANCNPEASASEANAWLMRELPDSSSISEHGGVAPTPSRGTIHPATPQSGRRRSNGTDDES
jgi:hypothetical protein